MTIYDVSDETRAAAKAAQDELVAACKTYVCAREAAARTEDGTTPEAAEAKVRLYRAASIAYEIDQQAAREARR